MNCEHLEILHTPLHASTPITFIHSFSAHTHPEANLPPPVSTKFMSLAEKINYSLHFFETPRKLGGHCGPSHCHVISLQFQLEISSQLPLSYSCSHSCGMSVCIHIPTSICRMLNLLNILHKQRHFLLHKNHWNMSVFNKSLET